MKLAFSTLGCPTWDLSQIVDCAVRNGYSGVEIRGVGEHVDLRQSPLFLPSTRKETSRRFTDAGVQLCCLSASASFANSTLKAASLDEARAFIDIASDIACPMVRVFGGSPSAEENDEDAVTNVVTALNELAPIAESAGVTVVLETHDAFSTGLRVAKALGQVPNRSIGALWDLHHPYRTGEAPDVTCAALSPYLRHTHVKDSNPDGYCLLGQGDVPIKAMVDLLLGLENEQHSVETPEVYLCLEWEKRWIPSLLEPEIAFTQYAAKLREYMGVTT